MRALVLALTALFSVACQLGAQVPASSMNHPRILILGTFHMANPGRDLHNIEADDVLSGRRQAEIAELVEVLERFRPTKIAVESPVNRGRLARDYADFLRGEYELTRNETDQIAFRLGRESGLPSIEPVDESGDFPFYRVQNYAIANGMKDAFDSLSAANGEASEALDAYLATHSILETLAYMNADSTVAKDVGNYYGFVPFGEPYEYAGPDLVAAWFQRNVRIYHNIRALVGSPTERVLVVYGAGHLGWLQRMVVEDPAVELVKLNDLMR